ncbi:MAG: tRNA dihydrouridine synthase DusB [Thermoplasmata archaeon]
MMFRIGNVRIEERTALAPMAGITNRAFRKVVKMHAAGLVYSEMVSAAGLSHGDKKSFEYIKIDEEEHPISVQIFGSNVEEMCKAAKIVESTGCDIIDINLGCSISKVMRSGAGAVLLKNPGLVEKIVRGVVSSVKIPVTVKMRAGFDARHNNALEIAKSIENAGAHAIALHPRFASQRFTGNADWSIIRQVKEEVSIPVIGNGDVKSIYDAERMIKETKCDAVMVGRGMLGRPWMLEHISRHFEGKKVDEPPFERKIEIARMHAKILSDMIGEKQAMLQMRKHLRWYAKGMPYSAEICSRLFRIENMKDFEDCIKKLEFYYEKKKVRSVGSSQLPL